MASIVDGHQVGVIVPVEEVLPMQRQKWLTLENTPYYALANPMGGSDSDLLDAGRGLVEQGRMYWCSTVLAIISITATYYKRR